MNEPVIDAEGQRAAREYARIRRRVMLAGLGLGGLYAAGWLLTGWALDLRRWLEGLSGSPWLLAALYGLVFGGGYVLINLPLDSYSGYVLPKRYGLSTQTWAAWVLDQIKGLALGGVFALAGLELIYALLRADPVYWWLWAAAALILFSVVLSIAAPVVLMPLFNKFKPLGEEYAELADRLRRLAERAGTRVQGVYQFDMSRRTRAANAALTGLGSTRRIILGDTLLAEFTPDEIETVLAHELGHHVNRDIPLLMAAQSLLTLAGLWLAALGLGWGVGYFGFNGPSDPATMPLLALLAGAFGLVTTPLENGISRWRERLADRYALESTGKPAAFASAMTRLANQNLAELEPEPWVEWLLYSHPALQKRIQMAEEWKVTGRE